MPKSLVICTSPTAASRLGEEARRKYAGRQIVPYTLSYAQRIDAGGVRVRLTELVDGALTQEWTELVQRGEATLASRGDRDVREKSFEELMAEANCFGREAVLQLVSPAVVEVDGRAQPFPVLQPIFEHYISVWNSFSEIKIEAGQANMEGLAHVLVKDFKLSCLATPFGAGSQGWMRLEMEKGRTEDEIGLFNGLVDFAFYCGTGLHTAEGLGQTRRLDAPGRPTHANL